jgi:hypothetical protein
MTHYWSQEVNETSDALDIKQGIFSSDDPKAIARSLKASADHSERRKAEPFRSAMSMLVFFINRAGKNLTADHRRTLEAAKDELRALYGKPPARKPAARKPSAKTSAKRATAKRKTAKRN